MSKDIRQRMSSAHEAYISKIFGGTRTPGSGNQARAQMDGRRNRYTHSMGWAWDCKATLAQSISINMPMWRKAVEQAGLDRPMIPLRMYQNDRLTEWTDLVAVRPEDFIEILERMESAEERLESVRSYTYSFTDPYDWDPDAVMLAKDVNHILDGEHPKYGMD